MNIDYASIIARANDRKEQLQKVDAMLSLLPAQIDALEKAISYFSAVNREIQFLDAEGKAMLRSVDVRVQWVSSILEDANMKLTRNDSCGSDQRNLAPLKLLIQHNNI